MGACSRSPDFKSASQACVYKIRNATLKATRREEKFVVAQKEGEGKGKKKKKKKSSLKGIVDREKA